MRTADCLKFLSFFISISFFILLICLMRVKNSLDCYCCCLQLNHWNKWLPVFTTGEVKSTEEGFADDTLVVASGPLQCLPAKKHATDPELHAELLCKSANRSADSSTYGRGQH